MGGRLGRIAAAGLAGLLALLAALGLRWTAPGEEARCAGQQYEVVTAPGGLSPYVRLDADGKSGAFLLDYGASVSTVALDQFAAGTDGVVAIKSFSLPSFGSGRFKAAKYWIERQPAGGQLGIVGTDFLSKLTVDFSFRQSGSTAVIGPQSCERAGLAKRGMAGVPQAGFFSSDVGRVALGRLNIPVLYVRIGGVAAWAQIDTGFDDSLHPAIDINEALYQKLVAAGVTLVPDGETGVATCGGQEAVSSYRITHTAVAIENGTATNIATLKDVRLNRKRANACGGIATLAEPAAQLGVSALYQIGDIVFDPSAEMVWVRSGGTIAK